MLDEKDLQAIGQLIDTKLAKQKDEILGETAHLIDTKLAKQKDDILGESTHRMKILLDTEVRTQFNLLAEGIQDIQEKLVPRSRVDEMEDEIKFLKSLIRQLNEDVQELKKAN